MRVRGNSGSKKNDKCNKCIKRVYKYKKHLENRVDFDSGWILIVYQKIKTSKITRDDVI